MNEAKSGKIHEKQGRIKHTKSERMKKKKKAAE